MTWGKETAKTEKKEMKQEVTEKNISKSETNEPVQDQSAIKQRKIVEEIKVKDISEIGVEGGVEGGEEDGVVSGNLGGVVGGVLGGVQDKNESPVRAVGEIKQPRLIKEVEPVYPEKARQARVEGVVIIEVTTDISGKVKQAKVLKSIPLLDQSAIDAVKQRIYEPMIINGKPRGVIFTVTIHFALK